MTGALLEDFRGGIDQRRSRLLTPGGSVWTLTNGHITRGGDIEKRKAAILEVVKQIRALPILDGRTDEEILGYDENGLPT